MSHQTEINGDKTKKKIKTNKKIKQKANEKAYHVMTIDEVKDYFKTDIKNGLSQEEAERRLAEDGKNELKGSDGVSPLTILRRNIVNGMNLILTAALIVCFATKQWIEGSTILIIIIFNTIIGFFQEYKSEQALASLKKMSAPSAIVIRDGVQREIKTSEVVKGDIVAIEMGDIVCADLRIIKSNNLAIDEALLTGESIPVEKIVDPLENEDEGVGDRINLAYMSSIVTKGKGLGIVIKTGMETEIGAIANKLSESSKVKSSPLKRKLDIIAYALFGVAVVLAIIVLGVNEFETKDQTFLLYAISVGICIIPEGLPAVLTLTMTTGVKTMTKQKAIVRRVMALEAIGAATNICSDKTGTLTEAKMFASKIWLPDSYLYSVTGQGFGLSGEIIDEKTDEPVKSYSFALDKILHCASLCNMASFEKKEDISLSIDEENNDGDEEEERSPIGDPTEIALMILSIKTGYDKEMLINERKFKLVQEHQFDSTVKRMSVVYKHKGEYIGFIKGAPERILDCCDSYLIGEEVKPINDDFLKKIQKINDKLASQGLRVLALAYRPKMKKDDIPKREDTERECVYIGFIGIYDPPRPESRSAVRVCHRAGITVHMATGDHPSTAKAIAKEVGILPEDYSEDLVMIAKDFDNLSDEEIDKMEELPLVVARCSPDTKVKLINALHRRKKLVVMTGDGVNDAPALSCSDIGVAMGKNGSDVAKDASDIVITDDNFATIVGAVAQGRRILHNITQSISHLLSGNVGQIVLLMIGLSIMDESRRTVFPLSPLQALWVNLIVSSPPAIGLGQQRQTKDAMRQKPKSASKRLSDFELIIDILYYGVIQGCLGLSAFLFTLYVIYDGELGYKCNKSTSESMNCEQVFKSRGVSFMVLCVLPFYHAYNCRSPRKPIWKTNFIQNKILLISILCSFVLTVIMVYIPFMHDKVFVMDPIGGYEWLVILVCFIIFMLLSEIYKFFKRMCCPTIVTDMSEPLEELELRVIKAK